jgi:hypothetical protein
VKASDDYAIFHVVYFRFVSIWEHTHILEGI